MIVFLVFLLFNLILEFQEVLNSNRFLKEENIENDIDNSNSDNRDLHKEKEKERDHTPNIIIYGSASDSENGDENNQDENKNEDDYFISKNLSNVSTGNINIINNSEKIEQKIVKPRSKPSGNLMSKLKIKNIKNYKKAKMSRKFTQNNIFHKVKISSSKYSSANDNEKNKDLRKKLFAEIGRYIKFSKYEKGYTIKNLLDHQRKTKSKIKKIKSGMNKPQMMKKRKKKNRKKKKKKKRKKKKRKKSPNQKKKKDKY